MEIAGEMRPAGLWGAVERSRQPWDELRHTRFSSLKQTLCCRGQAGRSPSLLIICGGGCSAAGVSSCRAHWVHPSSRLSGNYT